MKRLPGMYTKKGDRLECVWIDEDISALAGTGDRARRATHVRAKGKGSRAIARPQTRSITSRKLRSSTNK